MKQHNNLRGKAVALALSIALIMPCMPAEATIYWTDYVAVTQAQQVVDSITINGKTVNAVYARKGSFPDDDTTYSCAAFVKRFYLDVFGIDVYGLYADGLKHTPSGGDFSETANPVVGDIAANGSHWAIVKSVDGNKITLIEQNSWGINEHAYDACIHRVLEAESSYWFFHYTGNTLTEQAGDTGNDPSGTEPTDENPSGDSTGGGNTSGNDTDRPSDSIIVHDENELQNALTTGGYIVVDKDIRFQASQDGFYPTVEKPVILDLNGNTVNFDSHTYVRSDLTIVGDGKLVAKEFGVYDNATFVVDSGTIGIWELDLDNQSKIIVNGGTFTEGRMWVSGNIQINGGEFQDHSIRLFEGAQGKMTDGILRANLKSCLYLEASSRFEMNGGEICGIGAENPYFNCVENSGEFYLNGGSIHDERYGVDNTGHFTMTGGEIYNCVYGVNAGDDFTMSGGKIRDNKVGIYNASKGITLTGGEICNNQSGIDAWDADGTLTIQAGKIYSNASYGIRTCTNIALSGGKIYQNGGCGIIISGGTICLSGAPVIEGNLNDTGEAADLVTYSMMDAGTYWGEICDVEITDSLTNGCNIGIYSVDGIEGIFTTGYSDHNGTDDPYTYFYSDSNEYAIVLDPSGEVRLDYISEDGNTDDDENTDPDDTQQGTDTDNTGKPDGTDDTDDAENNTDDTDGTPTDPHIDGNDPSKAVTPEADADNGDNSNETAADVEKDTSALPATTERDDNLSSGNNGVTTDRSNGTSVNTRWSTSNNASDPDSASSTGTVSGDSSQSDSSRSTGSDAGSLTDRSGTWVNTGSSSSSSGSSSGSDSSNTSLSYTKGDTRTAGKGTARADYTKTSKNTVRYDASEISNRTVNATVPSTVKIGGKTYQVTSIAPEAFAGLTSLKTLTVGKNVKKIGTRAFDGCKNLTTLTINSRNLTKKSVNNSLKGASVKTIHVPRNKVNAYQNAFSKDNSGSRGTVTVKAKQ